MLEVDEKIRFTMIETAFENAFDTTSLLNLNKYLWSMRICGSHYDLLLLGDEDFKVSLCH